MHDKTTKRPDVTVTPMELSAGALYLEDLSRRCDEPTCACAFYEIRLQCHPDAALRMAIDGDRGVLRSMCRECGEQGPTVHIARRPDVH